ncbi:MAG: oligosaccharide flippase family protein [Rhodococcus sp. (in: high G+C Gram-positive bacteria)]|uniref:oligosaccharide flippase family protein n=1 Tax=Rhodococcus sp. TaxID=1831 RepID=UPI002ADA8F51|nr:oligosaccharide flippase family protein [Rhodococcus sp. (in: high G+C Gram-positive bacteria)]
MTNPLVVQFTGIAGGRLVGALIQALSMVLLARISGPSGFGIFAAAYGVGLVLQTVLNFGFTPFLVRIRALGDQEPLIASTLESPRRANLAVGALLVMIAAVASAFGAEALVRCAIGSVGCPGQLRRDAAFATTR